MPHQSFGKRSTHSQTYLSCLLFPISRDSIAAESSGLFPISHSLGFKQLRENNLELECP